MRRLRWLWSQIKILGKGTLHRTLLDYPTWMYFLLGSTCTVMCCFYENLSKYHVLAVMYVHVIPLADGSSWCWHAALSLNKNNACIKTCHHILYIWLWCMCMLYPYQIGCQDDYSGFRIFIPSINLLVSCCYLTK